MTSHGATLVDVETGPSAMIMRCDRAGFWANLVAFAKQIQLLRQVGVGMVLIMTLTSKT